MNSFYMFSALGRPYKVKNLSLCTIQKLNLSLSSFLIEFLQCQLVLTVFAPISLLYYTVLFDTRDGIGIYWREHLKSDVSLGVLALSRTFAITNGCFYHSFTLLCKNTLMIRTKDVLI